VLILEKEPEALFKFLHQVYLKKKILVKDLNERMIELYIKYMPSFLLDFLRENDNYIIPEVERKCEKAGLIIPYAFLLVKNGNSQRSVEVLIENSGMGI
jgi:hypothetical protein